MRKLNLLAAASLLALSACAGTPTTDAGTAALNSTPAGQVVQSYVSSLNSGLATALTNANADVAAAAPLLNTALALGNSLNTAFAMVAPLAGASADDVANEQKAFADLQLIASNPPSNVATAAAQAVATAATIKAQLAKVAPAAAAATVPAAS